MTSGEDDTVRLPVRRGGGPGRLVRFWPYAAGLLLVAALASGATWWGMRPGQQAAPAPTPVQQALAPAAPIQEAPVSAPAQPPAQPSAPTPVLQAVPAQALPGSVQQAFLSPLAPPAPPRYAPPLASEAEILADAPQQLAVYRFAQNPAVIVLQFPTLAEQAGMLNRIAALLEKEGYPRDRVLSHDELDAKIRASGMTPDTFYYGHDYRAADLMHFFDLAPDLNPAERQLLDLVLKLGWREHGATGALISLVRDGAAPDMDGPARATILRHELSHGVYFTDPAFAEYCQAFWSEVLTARERGLFTTYLQREGYDPALTDLLINETQAYLVHTRDRRFFRPTEVGLTDSRADELRRLFIAGMPPGWLRDADTAIQPQLLPVRGP